MTQLCLTLPPFEVSTPPVAYAIPPLVLCSQALFQRGTPRSLGSRHMIYRSRPNYRISNYAQTPRV